jgi:hypothetical protein
MNSLIQIETQWGKPIQFGERKVVVQSRALQIRLPFLEGGLVWNRPVSVLVESSDGHDQVLPVRDVTRIAQIALIALGLAGMILIGLIPRKTVR